MPRRLTWLLLMLLVAIGYPAHVHLEDRVNKESYLVDVYLCSAITKSRHKNSSDIYFSAMALLLSKRSENEKMAHTYKTIAKCIEPKTFAKLQQKYYFHEYAYDTFRNWVSTAVK